MRCTTYDIFKLDGIVLGMTMRSQDILCAWLSQGFSMLALESNHHSVCCSSASCDRTAKLQWWSETEMELIDAVEGLA